MIGTITGVPTFSGVNVCENWGLEEICLPHAQSAQSTFKHSRDSTNFPLAIFNWLNDARRNWFSSCTSSMKSLLDDISQGNKPWPVCFGAIHSTALSACLLCLEFLQTFVLLQNSTRLWCEVGRNASWWEMQEKSPSKKSRKIRFLALYKSILCCKKINSFSTCLIPLQES